MPREGATGWSKSATLPATPTSFAGVTYSEMLDRAHALVPTIAARAVDCEKLRRLPDETERDLHRTGLFRMVQPARVGGADLDVGILVDTCAAIARVCPSTAWNLGNLASHHWMLGYFEPEAQDEIWNLSRDTLIATSLVFPAGRGRKVEGGYEVDWGERTGYLRLALRHRLAIIPVAAAGVDDAGATLGGAGTDEPTDGAGR